MKKSLTLSIADLEKKSKELVSNARAIYPELPPANLLEHVIELADPDFLAELDGMLRSKHFLRIERAARLQQLQEERRSAWLSPEIRDAALVLPLRVPVGKGQTVSRDELSFPDTTRYLKILDKQDRESRDKNAKRAAIMAIRKLWPRSKRARRNMTLSAVDKLKAGIEEE